MIKKILPIGASLSTFFCTVGLSQGAALALTEGPSGVADGYGTDVYVNFPQTYTTGQYTLSWFQNVESTVDTIQSSYVSQGLMPSDFRTGTFPTTNGITGQVGSVPFARDVWQQHVISIDLDANTYSHVFNGGSVTDPGTTWDGQPDDANPPTLASLNIWIGNAGAGANLDGVDGSVFVDNFLLEDGNGTVLWSEDFESGLGSFIDFGGNVTPVVDGSMQVPEPSAAALGFLGFFCLIGRRNRK
jgi:hypothetical protein